MTSERLGRANFSVDIVSELQTIAEQDEAAGCCLQSAGHFRQAMYFFVQAMEKRVRARAFAHLNPDNRHLRELNHGHDLHDAFDLYLATVSGDLTMKAQVRDMVDRFILGDINFRHLHNALRYPHYSERRAGYTAVDYTESDCVRIYARLTFLKKFLHDLEARR